MSDSTPRRAHSMAEFHEIQGRLSTPEEFAAGLPTYRPRATDVIITPFGKCGTTWLQQTFHTLRTRGDMDFDDISRVVPWLETAGMLGLDLNAEQRAEPRGFKSHLAYDALPKDARYIVSLRDPRDALVSMHHFMVGWFIEPGTVSVADFYDNWRRGFPAGDYWSHLISWWNQRANPDVLLFSYEHMTADPACHVRRVAAFCGLPLDDELLALTLERTSLAYMLAHKDRFDDAMMRALSERRGNLAPGSDSAKVRRGAVGGHKDELPAEIAADMDAQWAKTVAPATGFADYAALEAELRRTSAG